MVINRGSVLKYNIPSLIYKIDISCMYVCIKSQELVHASELIKGVEFFNE